MGQAGYQEAEKRDGKGNMSDRRGISQAISLRASGHRGTGRGVPYRSVSGHGECLKSRLQMDEKCHRRGRS